jgi:hypothetical protein
LRQRENLPEAERPEFDVAYVDILGRALRWALPRERPRDGGS